MMRIRGPHLSTPLSVLISARDALARRDADQPGPDALYLPTRSGAVALYERYDGRLGLAVEDADPRRGGRAVAVLLGRFENRPLYGVELLEIREEIDDPGRELRDLRHCAERIAPEDLDLALAAVAMGAWHRSMRACTDCGGPLVPEQGGWVLCCEADGREHFPRTDPAVIMAVRDSQDRLLLAQGAGFRGRFHSVLAGFVEPGETAEAAVARETAEETGITVESVEYVGSQPWPFPRTLMLGFRAWAPGAAELRLQDEEIVRARWFSRDELAAALADGTVELPGTASLGRALIRDWYEADGRSLGKH